MKKILLILSILLALFGLFGCENAAEPAVEVSEVISEEVTKWDEIVQRNELRIGVPSTDHSFDNELIDAFAEEAGIRVSKVVVPWGDSAVERIQNGDVDMLWGQIPATAETSSAFRLSAPYVSTTTLYIATSPTLVPEQTTVVGVLEDSVEEIISTSYYDTVRTYPNRNELFAALYRGECEMVLDSKPLFQELFGKTGKLHIIKEAPCELVVAFEQNNVSVATEVDKILAKIKADGTASEICLRWYPVDLIAK